MADEKSTPAKIAETLASVRNNLGELIEGRFPKYVNATLLWQNQSTHSARPVLDTDPASIQFCKHCLLALESAERIAYILQEYTNRSLGGRILSAPTTLYNTHQIYKNEFSKHLDLLKAMGRNADLPAAIRNSLNSITNTMLGLNLQQVNAGQLNVRAKSLSSTLDQEFLGLMDTYFDFQNPPAPTLPEMGYQVPEEKKSIEKGKKEIVRLLEPATKILEPINTGLLIAGKTHKKLVEIMQDSNNNGVFSKSEIEYIKKTSKALDQPPIDQNGYLELKTKENSVEETRLSEALKAGFNLIWSFNELCTDPNPGVLDYFNAFRRTSPHLEVLKNLILETEGMSENLKKLYDASIKAMLIESRDLLLPGLQQLTEKVHAFEKKNHLRYGALLDEVRPTFDAVETLYIKYGVPITNPFGNVAKQKEQPNENALLKKTYETIYKQTMTTRFLDQSLQKLLNKKRIVKIDLLQQLNYLKSFATINANELAAINAIETRLVNNLTNSETLQLLARLINHSESDKYQSLREKLEQHQGAKTTSVALPMKALNLTANFVSNLVSNLNKKLTNETFNYQGHLESLSTQESIRLEWFSRTLTNNGLNYYLRAIEVAADDKHATVNLAHKRETAVLLADYHHVDRVTFLEQAHNKAKDFLLHRDQIIHLVKDIHSNKVAINNAKLGHALAIELVLSGHTNVNDWNPQILSSNNESATRQDLLNALTRLEAGQVLALLDTAKKGDANALKRLAVFNLLTSEDKLSTAAITNILSNPQPSTDPMLNWLHLLTKRYLQLSRELEIKKRELPKNMRDINAWISEQPEKELMNKIGLFLARIANANEDAAKIIFTHTKPYSILDECLTTSIGGKSHQDKALYYEASVNTVTLNNNYNAINYPQFIDNNQKIILLMNQALNPNSTLSTEEIITYYKTNPWVLCKLTEQFTNTCLSSNSKAREKLRDFFSAMALCNGKESATIRQEMFRIFIDMGRSVRAPYIALLTDKASNVFWQRVRDDILSKPKITFDTERQEISDTLTPLLTVLSSAGSRNFFVKTINDFVNKQATIIGTALSDLKSNDKGDFLLNCSRTQLKTNDALNAVKNQKSIWVKAIVAQRLDELKTELASRKKEMLKASEELMKKTDKEFSKTLLQSMHKYNPEFELDTLQASMTFTQPEEAIITCKTLSIRKAQLLQDMNKQFHSWSEDIADATIRYNDIKVFKESLNHLLDTFENKKLRSREKNALLEPFNKRLSLIKDIFTQSNNYWQDAGKFYAAITDIYQLHTQHIATNKELEEFYANTFKHIQAYTHPNLDTIATKIQQNIIRFVSEHKPENIEAIIKHFPQSNDNSKLSVSLLLGSTTKENLNSLNQIPEMMITPPFIADEAFKNEITNDLNNCFKQQQQIAEKASKLLNEKKADTGAIAKIIIQEQKILGDHIQIIADRIVRQQQNNFRISLSDTYNKYRLEIQNRFTNAPKNAKAEIGAKILLANPTTTLDAFFATQKLTTIEDKKTAIAAIAARASEQNKSLTYHYQTWLTDAYENASPGGNKQDQFKSALAQIKEILSSYLSDRKKYALFYSFIGLELRAQKIALVSDCLEKINEIEGAFNHTPTRYNEYAHDISQHISNLETKHFALVGNNEKKAGILKGNIDDIYEILRPIQEWQARSGVGNAL